MAITIDEAITLQTSLKESDILKYHPDLRDSTQLGIEALNREQGRRKYLVNSAGELLPGETEGVRDGSKRN